MQTLIGAMLAGIAAWTVPDGPIRQGLRETDLYEPIRAVEFAEVRP